MPTTSTMVQYAFERAVLEKKRKWKVTNNEKQSVEC